MIEDMDVLIASKSPSSRPCPAVVLNSTVKEDVVLALVVAKSAEV